VNAAATHTELQALCPGFGTGSDGRLEFAGIAVADLAAEFGTAAMVVDVSTLRSRAREYVDAMQSRWADSEVYFASKSFPCSAVIRVLGEEGLGCDVASAGELAFALAGGMAPERILLHGNAKTDLDIEAAVEAEIGLIVIDSFDDIDRIERLAREPQPVLIRINPGVLAPTHEAMATGHVNSKFGIPGGQVDRAIGCVEDSSKMIMRGLHVHIGSQILELEPFVESVKQIASLGDFPVYDLGGGLGVRYTMDEPEGPDPAGYVHAMLEAVRDHLSGASTILIEPGRSVVGPAAITMYSVTGVKRGARTFVSVDGGMGDNMEPALYGTRFWPAIVDRDSPGEPCDVVGHHCETGDRLVVDAWLNSPEVGDLLVMPVTGGYCHSMANTYNGMPRPPVVFAEDGEARLVVRREKIADLLSREC
jgi:diaminopimelate decarboxylase